ncbi:hypothetical protein NM208_g11073 [Fusarium decemcellulare]|uniref:Uncharacterized protein n=1 Tax=Fusarium decemcellulare TaxID=57161 RepID=A0ACC1RVM0_9HYPO|nr:hypothetical protein NM208_g11073 [Fusarium decemcellulare]
MPSVQVPVGQTSVKVTVIDNGARAKGSWAFFLDPPLHTNQHSSAPAYVFMIEHENSGSRVLFDLGIRKNYDEYPPFVREYHKKVAQFETGDEIFDMLQSRGIDLLTVNHHHLDHTGNPTGFPPTTNLVVGPGFKETLLPGYPTNPDGLILESDYEGRELRELDFEKESHGLRIGEFRAIDFFGDGSFYLLETPGHTIDHLAGFARTSVNPPRFIFMGGDIGHHASQWRPTDDVPLPDTLCPSPLGPDAQLNVLHNVCPGEIFVEHAHPKRSRTSPFHRIKAGHPFDVDMAQATLKSMEAFDADENILVVTAHDYTLIPYMQFWPETANDWHKIGCKEQSRWEFLKDFIDIVQAKVSGSASASFTKG